MSPLISIYLIGLAYISIGNIVASIFSDSYYKDNAVSTSAILFLISPLDIIFSLISLSDDDLVDYMAIKLFWPILGLVFIGSSLVDLVKGFSKKRKLAKKPSYKLAKKLSKELASLGGREIPGLTFCRGYATYDKDGTGVTFRGTELDLLIEGKKSGVKLGKLIEKEESEALRQANSEKLL